jgi:hypothetical protein
MAGLAFHLRNGLAAAALAFAAGAPGGAAAHHSFAIWDFDVEIPFEGVVDTLNFRNPHIRMTLARERDDGQVEVIVFSEGAPANMLVRLGLTPDMISPGTRITAIGSPHRDRPDVYFLRVVRLEDGREF